jgi:hypothetical protein
MIIDVASNKFSFAFAPHYEGTLSPSNPSVEKEGFLQALGEEVSNKAAGSEACIREKVFYTIVSDYPALFSPTLGMANVPCVK